jgi:hypothetical protein
LFNPSPAIAPTTPSLPTVAGSTALPFFRTTSSEIIPQREDNLIDFVVGLKKHRPLCHRYDGYVMSGRVHGPARGPLSRRAVAAADAVGLSRLEVGASLHPSLRPLRPLLRGSHTDNLVASVLHLFAGSDDQLGLSDLRSEVLDL